MKKASWFTSFVTSLGVKIHLEFLRSIDFFTRRRAQGIGFKADGLIDQIGPTGHIGPIENRIR